MNFNNQKGIIPLFIIIPIALLATGVIGVKTGYFRMPSRGIFKFLAPPSPSNLPKQIGNFQQDPAPKVTVAPTDKIVGERQIKPFVYQEEDKIVDSKNKEDALTVPSFTISAPYGWVKTDSSGNELARFESTEIDEEEVEEGMITTNAIINIRGTDGYQNLDELVSQYQASGSQANGYRLLGSSSRGDDGHSLELTYTTEIDGMEVTIHELDYLFYKDGVSFLVKGYCADSAWGKHSGEIRLALESFKFN